MPVSSTVSRCAAASGVSPGSTCPPGRSGLSAGSVLSGVVLRLRMCANHRPLRWVSFRRVAQLVVRFAGAVFVLS